jgi:hypothetical protein
MMSNEPDGVSDSLNILDDIAKRRREEVQTQSAKPLPDFIESITQTEVRYIFRPDDLPLGQVDAAKLVESVIGSYGVQLDSLDIGELLQTVPRERLLKMDDNEVLALLLRSSGSKKLRFIGGKFPLKFDFVPIRSISIDFESIHVSVAGISDVAETVTQETLQMIWKAAGSDRDLASILKTRAIVGYATGTRIALPFPLERLLSPRLQKHFEDHFLAGERFGAKFRGLSRRNGFNASENIVCTVAVDDLTFTVHSWDPISGSQESQDLRFAVTARDDYGTGNVRVSSTLSFSDHVRFLEILIEDLN